MVVAIYRSNQRSGREQILVTQDEKQMLHIVTVNAQGETKIPGIYKTVQDVEAYLKERNPDGYMKVA